MENENPTQELITQNSPLNDHKNGESNADRIYCRKLSLFCKNSTLSMIAANLRPSAPQLDRQNVVEVDSKLALLRTAIIYGANASGKSNLIKAASFMRHFVLNSARMQDEDAIPVEPSCLDESSSNSPAKFEIVFLLEGLQYRYGFSATKNRVVEEWLYFIRTKREVKLFTRVESELQIGSLFSEGRGLQEFDINNKLFLSVVAQSRKEGFAQKVRNWFLHSFSTLSADEDINFMPYIMECIETGKHFSALREIVHRFDLDISGLNVAEIPIPANIASLHDFIVEMTEGGSDSKPSQLKLHDQTSERTLKQLRTVHDIRDKMGLVVEKREFPASEMESRGTTKLIALLGPLLDVLVNGKVLFLDEIDSRLHPMITAAIINLFNSPETNPKNAQLICNTHDTNLLDRHLFRRDQIFFVEKNGVSVSHLYSLADFKLKNSHGADQKNGNESSFEKDYIQGRFGAIPYLGNFSSLFIEESQHGETTEESRSLVGVEQ